MPPKKQSLGSIPIPYIIHFSQSLFEKTLLERGGIDSSSYPHQKKNILKKKTNPNPLSLFLKIPVTTYNFFNLIELSTPYTY